MQGCGLQRSDDASETAGPLVHTNRDKVPDLSFLSTLKTIESIGIGYITYLRAVPDLSQCKRLKSLTIFNCKSLHEIASVTSIPKLQSFSIVCTPQMPHDLETIMAMKTLKTMSGAFGNTKRDDEFQRLLDKYGLEYA